MKMPPAQIVQGVGVGCFYWYSLSLLVFSVDIIFFRKCPYRRE